MFFFLYLFCSTFYAALWKLYWGRLQAPYIMESKTKKYQSQFYQSISMRLVEINRLQAGTTHTPCPRTIHTLRSHLPTTITSSPAFIPDHHRTSLRQVLIQFTQAHTHPQYEKVNTNTVCGHLSSFQTTYIVFYLTGRKLPYSFAVYSHLETEWLRSHHWSEITPRFNHGYNDIQNKLLGFSLINGQIQVWSVNEPVQWWSLYYIETETK